MRWYWIDRFIEFESGLRAKAVKNVSLAEEHLHDHFPDYPVMPNSLVIEGVAQTGGLLICEHGRFEKKVVLAKVSKAVFHCEAVPGDTLIYTAVANDIREDGAMVTATSYLGDRLQAEMELFFAHLDEEFSGKDLFEPGDLMKMMRIFGAFDVGRSADGSPLADRYGPADAARLASP